MTDLELRHRTYALFVQLGRAPLSEELGARDEVLAGWSRLHDAHALVLWPDRAHIRMLNPFSAVPTAHRVRAGGRWWYGNCAWDGRKSTSNGGSPVASRDEPYPWRSCASSRRHGGATDSTRPGARTRASRTRRSLTGSASPASSGACLEVRSAPGDRGHSRPIGAKKVSAMRANGPANVEMTSHGGFHER